MKTAEEEKLFDKYSEAIHNPEFGVIERDVISFDNFIKALAEHDQEIDKMIEEMIENIEKLYKEQKTLSFSADEKIEALTELKKELSKK